MLPPDFCGTGPQRSGHLLGLGLGLGLADARSLPISGLPGHDSIYTLQQGIMIYVTVWNSL